MRRGPARCPSSSCCWVVSLARRHLPKQLDAHRACWVGCGGGEARAARGSHVSLAAGRPSFPVLGAGKGISQVGKAHFCSERTSNSISCPGDLHPLAQRDLKGLGSSVKSSSSVSAGQLGGAGACSRRRSPPALSRPRGRRGACVPQHNARLRPGAISSPVIATVPRSCRTGASGSRFLQTRVPC